jgi:hypothetical protein
MRHWGAEEILTGVEYSVCIVNGPHLNLALFYLRVDTFSSVSRPQFLEEGNAKGHESPRIFLARR